jgi:DNA-directed RNA polymerase subunit RPC12/RpoP
MKFKKFNPMYWIRKLNGVFVKFENIGREGMIELACDLQDKDSKINCQYCGSLLNLLKMPILASNVKIGKTYKIKCNHCKKFNTITKGTEKYKE